MEGGKFELREFDMSSMVINPAIVMIAKRGSGKSWVTRDILYNLHKHKNIPCGVVIAPTDRMNPMYKYFFPDLFIHYEIKPELLRKILLRQTTMIEKEKDKKKEGKKIDPSAVLVMDDCLSQAGKWGKDETIKEIMMNGRHYKLTYILTMQTPLGLGPDLRLNFDYIFLLKEDTAVNRKKLYDNYAGMFPTLRIFEKVFSQCTSDFRCMVIDNRKPSDKIEDKVFWYKAQDRKFSFGSRKFIDMHRKYYDKDFMKKRISLLGGGMNNLKKKGDIDIRVDMVN